MDMETCERLIEIASKDFPEVTRDPFEKSVPDPPPANANDFKGQLLTVVDPYLRAFHQLYKNGAPASGEEHFASVYDNFMNEIVHLHAIFAKVTVTTPRHIDRAVGYRNHFNTQNKMEKFVRWFGLWSLFTTLPLQYSLIKQEIVDKEQIFDERQFIRKLHRLCEIGILERVEHIRPNPKNPKNNKPNVYYKVNPDFYEHRTDMYKLEQFMPEILTILVRLAFEKNLAVSYLRANNLHTKFEDENRAFSSLLDSY